ncbi:MAG TPA: hypothetical protein VMF62_04605 [Acetobacteraceae bacterium]|nr:hypothetical protein [Acetobacteraceae bacterium]
MRVQAAEIRLGLRLPERQAVLARRFRRGREGADAHLEKGGVAERAKERRAPRAGEAA